MINDQAPAAPPTRDAAPPVTGSAAGRFAVGLLLLAFAGLTGLFGPLLVMASDNCFEGDARIICSTGGRQIVGTLPVAAAFSAALLALVGMSRRGPAGRGCLLAAARRLVERPLVTEGPPYAIWPYHLHAALRTALRTAGDHAEDRWPPADRHQAAERTLAALGRQWQDAAGARTTGRALLVACLRQGLRHRSAHREHRRRPPLAHPLIETATAMGDQPQPANSTTQWLDNAHIVRQRWRALVTTRQDHLRGAAGCSSRGPGGPRRRYGGRSPPVCEPG
ncbi:hypothetical protein [Streptomyces sp. NPDC055299]